MKFCNDDYISLVGTWKHAGAYPCEISVKDETVTAKKEVSISLYKSKDQMGPAKGEPGYDPDFANFLICITVDEGEPGESKLITTPAYYASIKINTKSLHFYTEDYLPTIESIPLICGNGETGHMWKIKSAWWSGSLNKHVIGGLLSIDELKLGPK